MNLYYDGDIIQSSILIMSFYKKAGDQNLLKTTNKFIENEILVRRTCKNCKKWVMSLLSK